MNDLITKLCQIIAEFLSENPQADRTDLAAFVKSKIEADSQLSEDIRLTQINLGDGRGFQTWVTGGIANIGIHLNDVNRETLLEVLQEILFPKVKQHPHNLSNSIIPKFVGRDQDLIELKNQLQESERVAISTLTGMGGIGKTELALQFAWQQWLEKAYEGGICWLNVADSDSNIVGTSILDFARTYLKLTLPDEGELSERIRYCWQHWLEGNVLIIFDDVRDFQQIKDYLPPREEKRFQVLMTTRKEFLSATIQTFHVEVLEEEDALNLLRSYLEDDRIDTQIEEAKLLCHDLGCLPLGLELVARLLRRRQDWTIKKIRDKLTENGLEDKSLERNPKFDKEMTAERGVKAAFNLSWKELNSEPEAQILALYLSLFALAPFPKGMILDLFPDEEEDTVEEWLTDSLVHLSLVKNTEGNWYQIHPLLRRYFKDKLEASPHAEPAKRCYCVIMAKKSAEMPQTPTLEIIEAFEPFLLHLQASVRDYHELIADEDLFWSYTGLAWYYNGQGLYAAAEPYYQACLTATQTQLGENHLDTASSLNNLAGLYESQGRYSEAEPLFIRALSITEQQLGKNHPSTALSLNNLAGLYESQGRYSEAEPLYIRALSIREQQLGENHPDTARSLNNLALLYHFQGRYSEAEPLFIRALSIYEQQLGENHPDTASSLNNLAELYRSQGRYSEAEPLFIRALSIYEQQLGENHPDTATNLNNLALLYHSQGRYSEAEPLYVRALSICEQQLGKNHPDTATNLNNLAGLYESQGRYSEAEPLYVRALSICEQQLGKNHPDTATSLNNLALFYETQGKLDNAESYAQRALIILQTTIGNEHPHTLSAMLTVKSFQMMKQLGCNKDTLLSILQSIAQANNIPQLNTEILLQLLEFMESQPQLIEQIRESLS
jgi:tetratricopeptide (TPR) repeat protein